MSKKNGVSYRLDWDAGAHAEVELFRPDSGSGNASNRTFKMKYTPPFRGTYRPPALELNITLATLERLVGQKLRDLTGLLDGGGAIRGKRGQADDRTGEIEASFERYVPEDEKLGSGPPRRFDQQGQGDRHRSPTWLQDFDQKGKVNRLR